MFVWCLGEEERGKLKINLGVPRKLLCSSETEEAIREGTNIDSEKNA